MQNEVEKYYNLNDPSKKGPRGFVFAYDENGELLFTQENMIVLTGREAIASYGFDKEGTSKINSVVLSNETEPTTPDILKVIYPKENNRDIKYMIINEREENDEFVSNLENISVNSKGQFIDLSDRNEDTGEYKVIVDETDNYDSKFAIKYNFDFENGKPYALCKIFFTNTPYYFLESETNKNIDGNHFVANKITNKFSCIRLYMGTVGDAKDSVLSTPETPFKNATLFSRVVFPEYTKTIRNFIVFKYYIYF